MQCCCKVKNECKFNDRWPPIACRGHKNTSFYFLSGISVRDDYSTTQRLCRGGWGLREEMLMELHTLVGSRVTSVSYYSLTCFVMAWAVAKRGRYFMWKLVYFGDRYKFHAKQRVASFTWCCVCKDQNKLFDECAQFTVSTFCGYRSLLVSLWQEAWRSNFLWLFWWVLQEPHELKPRRSTWFRKLHS